MGKKFKKFISLALSFAILATFCTLPITASAEDTNLKFASDGKFKIVIFSDVQDQYPVHQRVIRIMEQAIERETPDLVVFTGDMTEINTKDVEVDYRRTVEQILGPVVKAGIPYSIVFGNHDNQSYYTGTVTDRAAMLAVWQSIGNCLTTDPAPELTGAGTCKIPIYASNGNDVAFSLWMVDSGSYQNPLDRTSGYDNPHADQLAWMAANNGENVNSIVFQHIPMPETYNLFVEDENGEKTYGDKKYTLALKEGVTGTAGEFPATIYAHDNTGEFQTLKEMGNVLGVFNGHDHLNDFSGTYDGIRITSVPGMSYFNYGDEAIRGYGVIELDEADLSTFDYHSVKFSTLDAESGASTETTYDVYDEITYDDLKENGNKLGDDYTISGGHTFTYDATSPSYSAVFKYRWTAGSKPGYQVSFDLGENGNIAYPFGVWIKRADQVAPNGAWHLKPNVANLEVKMDSAVSQGDVFDIELGRLKVLTGAPQYVGMYYVYLKVNGVLIQEGYTNTDENGAYTSGGANCQVSNIIRFGGWGNGGDDKISALPFAEEYEYYDTITYDDLLIGGNSANVSGIDLGSTREYTYNATSQTHSTVFKFRWTAGAEAKFATFFDYWGNYAFGFSAKAPNGGTGGGVNAGENGAWHVDQRKADNMVQMAEPIKSGDIHDIEFARLKVKNGDNKGLYYVYLKVDGELIKDYYIEATEELTNKILFVSSTGDNFICATPEFYAYDEIAYDDLFIGGNPAASSGIDLGSTREYTYNATSDTYSTAFKFRWTAGANPQFSLYFDYWGNYPFGLAVKGPNSGKGGGVTAGENGAWHLNPSKGGNIVQMSAPIVEGNTYDIEFGRLKVKTGVDRGKYYVYLKVDGELIQGYYVEATEELTNKILFVSSTADNCISGTPEEEPKPDEPEEDPNAPYYAYDEITYSDLKKDGNSVSSDGTNINSGNVFTYDATSPTYSAIFKFRWTAGSDTGIQFSFDKMNTNEIAYPFGVWVKKPNNNGSGPNGAWHLKPTDGNLLVDMDAPVSEGNTYDIELARLKVKNGDNAGKYYVYLKVDGELIQETYVEINEDGTYTSGNASCHISNEITFCDWGGYNNIISATPIPVIYEAYDEIGFDDLFVGSTSMSGQTMTSDQNYTYNATSSSYSMIFKYRWIAGGDKMKFTTFLDDWVYPFCFAAKTPNQAGFGAQAGPNGAWHLVPSKDSFIVDMDTPIVAGQAYDIELARLKVANGVNAGKYYVYAKVNGELIQSYYYDGVSNGAYGNGTQLSNKIIIAIPSGNKVTATPYVEEYEAYDEIGYEDLKDADGNSLGNQKAMSGANVFTYDKTSATGSVIFKYRWKIGTVPKFQMSFEKTANDAMAYMFGAWLSAPGEEANFPNGRMWLRPGMGPQVNMEEVLVAGTTHNVEFARLKVKNGPNKGKYYVYIKIDDILVAEDYVAADVVDANGNYTTEPGNTTLALSNEIFFAFWNSEGNIITSYRDGNATHEGSAGDFDNDGVIDAADLVVLRKILLGTQDTGEMPEGIADFNVDGKVNIIDLVAMKKYLAPANTYARQGSLALGTQEHLLSDATKTAEYIADASAVLGASAYRLSRPIHTLYNATSSNSVTVNETNMAQFREMVEALKAKGITEILYVTDAFVLPYGYYNSETTHHKTVPDPKTDTENYIAWLTVNAAAFKALAEEFPEIKYFEPYNEPNVGGNRLEKYGIGWNATEEEQAAHAFTTKEKAGIMADLCWYISRAVKSVDTANQVTTPSISVDTNHSHVDGTFLDALYAAIEAGNHPTNRVVADKRVDNYFTIINIHSYVSYSSSQAQNNVNEWAARINAAYDVVKAHGDGGSRVWLSETGMSTSVAGGRDEDKAANFIKLALEKLNSDITFIDTAFIYKLADISSDMGQSAIETAYGLFYSGDDLDNPYGAKATAKAVYSFCHNGSTDYSELDALVSRYAE